MAFELTLSSVLQKLLLSLGACKLVQDEGLVLLVNVLVVLVFVSLVGLGVATEKHGLFIEGRVPGDASTPSRKLLYLLEGDLPIVEISSTGRGVEPDATISAGDT